MTRTGFELATTTWLPIIYLVLQVILFRLLIGKDAPFNRSNTFAKVRAYAEMLILGVVIYFFLFIVWMILARDPNIPGFIAGPFKFFAGLLVIDQTILINSRPLGSRTLIIRALLIISVITQFILSKRMYREELKKIWQPILLSSLLSYMVVRVLYNVLFLMLDLPV